MTQPRPEHAKQDPRPCNPAAAIMAWIFPGLGHLYLGQRKRGWLVMFGILFLFFSGLLVGGLDAVDLKNDRLWFIAQAFNGPIAFIADFLNQALVQKKPEELRLSMIGLGHVNALATLFIALGGLLNLVVMLDALYPQERHDQPNRRSDDP
ncbi:MAG: hypothetical protein MK116_11140 [Phycisphaerales bacterium]|nr:hypothetical protein [Phycisphaerales bacterium]